MRYRSHLESRQLAPGTVNLRLGAVPRLAYEAADCGLLSADLAAGIRRVKGAKRLGMQVGNWLSAEQGKSLLRTVDVGSLRGKRDYATLAILLGCGLRRAEPTALRVEDIQQREEHWVICRSCWQGRPHTNHSGPGVGESRNRLLDGGFGNHLGHSPSLDQ